METLENRGISLITVGTLEHSRLEERLKVYDVRCCQRGFIPFCCRQSVGIWTDPLWLRLETVFYDIAVLGNRMLYM